MFASRNISLCTKDCLCLFVCPTGATNTETGQIDKDACISGCRACVDVCPSHAISLVPHEYPTHKEKAPQIIETMRVLLDKKSDQEMLSRSLLLGAAVKSPLAQLLKALELSSRILGEDCARESGFMMPQSPGVKALPK